MQCKPWDDRCTVLIESSDVDVVALLVIPELSYNRVDIQPIFPANAVRFRQTIHYRVFTQYFCSYSYRSTADINELEKNQIKFRKDWIFSKDGTKKYRSYCIVLIISGRTCYHTYVEMFLLLSVRSSDEMG